MKYTANEMKATMIMDTYLGMTDSSLSRVDYSIARYVILAIDIIRNLKFRLRFDLPCGRTLDNTRFKINYAPDNSLEDGGIYHNKETNNYAQLLQEVSYAETELKYALFDIYHYETQAIIQRAVLPIEIFLEHYSRLQLDF